MERRRFVHLVGTGALGLSVVRPEEASAGPAPPGRGGPREGRAAPPSALLDDPLFEATARLVEAKRVQYGIPGVALAVHRGGRSWTRGFGLTSVDDPQPITPDTVFPIASISKTVVATAVMRLHDQGRLDVEAPVVEFLPDFRLSDAGATREVRIWHLLTHTPGWEGQLGTPDRGPATLEHFIETLRELPQLARPGEVWSYNNAGWGVAGRVLEVVTDSSIGEALDTLVFAPLGLHRATSSTGVAMSYRFAQPHRQEGNATRVIRPFALPANVAAGGCAMSVDSLIRYARFHLGDGTTPGGERLLSRESLEAIRTPRIRKNSSSDEMGLGWHLRTLDGVLTAQHGGTLGGHCLHVQLVPERDLCFAILTNHAEGWRLNEDVGAAILQEWEGVALAPGQATGGNRGGNERMTSHAAPLAEQPSLEEYAGLYLRPPVGDVLVQVEGTRLVVGAGDNRWGLTFWAPDMAHSTGPGAYPGLPVEFIRDDRGVVTWIRVNGRIARKKGTQP